MAKKTASGIADQIAGLAEKLQATATTEARTGLARHIEAHFLTETGRAAFSNVAPDDSVTEALAWGTMQDPRLQALRDRFETDGVSEDFRAGLLFALRLVADTEYDY